ncbi:hypothetical protein HHI36_023305 [Cryptolaemus montrouzieri]|uniref:Uncharacterized protein n=1 Tax=Cryptolaemus montrouzieri TaxID=559131 RepID=A0ABD2PGK2_9CUCU
MPNCRRQSFQIRQKVRSLFLILRERPQVLIAHGSDMKETKENMKFLLEEIKCSEQVWKCGEFEVIALFLGIEEC